MKDVKILTPREQKIFMFATIGLVLFGIYYSLNSPTLFGSFLDQLTPVNWDEVHERNITKASIPITLLETKENRCLLTAEAFDQIADNQYFVRADELVNKLQYDADNKTIVLSCDELPAEKSRLNVWIVLEESPNHPTKYEYFLTEWVETPKE